MIARVIGHIQKLVGEGVPRLSILASSAFALASFFYVYTFVSSLKITTYSLHHRVTYYEIFDKYVIDRHTDHIIIVLVIILWFAICVKGRANLVVCTTCGGMIIIISTIGHLDSLLDIAALSSIPIALSFLLYNKITFKKNKRKIVNRDATFVINYLAIIGIAIGVISVTVTLSPIFPALSYSIAWRNYTYEIFVFFSSFSPILMLLLISYLPVKFFIKELMAWIFKIKNHGTVSVSSSVTSIKSRTKGFYLLFFMLLSVTLALIPHLPTINRDNQYVGVDTIYYINWLNGLAHSHSFQDFIHQAFVKQSLGDRPLSLILLYGVQRLGITNVANTIEYVPIILGPMLVLAIFFLTHELTLNDKTALLASFLTAVSFQTLIGIYAGFYANLFALTIGFLSFVFLFKFLKVRSKKNVLIYAGLIISLLFVHVYTWSIIAIVTTIFLVVMFKLRYYNRTGVAILLLIVLSSIAIDVARTMLTSSRGGVVSDFDVAITTGAGTQQFAFRWGNLTHTVYTFVGGLFSNIIILSLGFYWLLLSDLRNSSSIFLAVYLTMGLIAFLLGNFTIQTRIFYDIPFQIPAAIGLTQIMNRVGAFTILPVGIWLVSISIYAVSNFYLILPS